MAKLRALPLTEKANKLTINATVLLRCVCLSSFVHLLFRFHITYTYTHIHFLVLSHARICASSLSSSSYCSYRFPIAFPIPQAHPLASSFYLSHFTYKHLKSVGQSLAGRLRKPRRHQHHRRRHCMHPVSFPLDPHRHQSLADQGDNYRPSRPRGSRAARAAACF
jgi:hypothetical protein